MAFKPEGQETLGMTITFTKNFQRAFGTFPLKGDTLSAAIAAALAVGYRAFDTAQWYGNEADTGAALKASGVARKDLCITTKVSPQNLGPHTFLSSIEASLKALRSTRSTFSSSIGRQPMARLTSLSVSCSKRMRAALRPISAYRISRWR